MKNRFACMIRTAWLFLLLTVFGMAFPPMSSGEAASRAEGFVQQDECCVPHASAAVSNADEAAMQTNVSAADRDRTSVVVIVSVPGFSFQEWFPESLALMPELRAVMEKSAIAALNVRTPERGVEDVYLTINSGAPAIAPSRIRAFPADGEQTEARQRYMRYTGRPVGTAAVVVPEIEYLKDLHETLTYDAQIGKLGDALLRHGVRTAVFADWLGGEHPAEYAPLMLMTSAGTVQLGAVGDDVSIRDPDSPKGRATDAERMMALVRAMTEDENGRDEAEDADGSGEPLREDIVILIEYNDWFRLDQEQRNYEPDRLLIMQRRELEKIDAFLGRLRAWIDTFESGQLWLMSPQPHSAASRAKLYVTPLLIYDVRADASGPRLLTSPTTRRAGLISLHDVGPTLLETLGIEEREGWTGFAAVSEAREDALEWLIRDVRKMRNVYELRTIAVIPFVMYEVIVLLVSLAFVLLKKRKWLAWMKWPLYSLLSAPFLLLLLGFAPQWNTGVQLAVFVIALMAASAWCMLLPTETAIFLIASANAVALIADGLLGARLIRYSMMGYDPMIGARYYGIGNEFMGVLVGSSLLAALLALQRLHNRLNKIRLGETEGRGSLPERADFPLARASEGTAARPLDPSTTGLPSRRLRRSGRMTWRAAMLLVSASFICITLYLAAPNGGTNAGGALTACAAYGVAWLRMFGHERIRQMNLGRLALVVFLMLVVGLTLLWTMNQWLSEADAESKSHIGRAMDLLEEGRPDLILGIIVRKLQMNITLIGVSSWGKVLLTSVFVLAVLLLRPRGMLKRWQESRPHWLHGFTAIIIGSIVALALNDSGIVAAGTMIIFAAAPILLLISEQLGQSGRTE